MTAILPCAIGVVSKCRGARFCRAAALPGQLHLLAESETDEALLRRAEQSSELDTALVSFVVLILLISPFAYL